MGRKKEVGEMGRKEVRRGEREREEEESGVLPLAIPKSLTGSLHLCLEHQLSLSLFQTHSGSQPALPGFLPRSRRDLKSGGTPSPRDR